MNKFSITTYRKLVGEDKYLKGLVNIGYNYKAKGANYVWYKLYGNRVDKKNIKERLFFKIDKRLPKDYRTTPFDYLNSRYDRGHLASDASYDYSVKSLNKVYIYSNVVPQKHKLNSGTWFAFEKYSRIIARKLGYLYVINIMVYADNKSIGNNVKVPTYLYKVLLNKKHKFLRIFRCNQNNHRKKLKRFLSNFSNLKLDIEHSKTK